MTQVPDDAVTASDAYAAGHVGSVDCRDMFAPLGALYKSGEK